MKTGEEKQIVREMRRRMFLLVALLEAGMFLRTVERAGIFRCSKTAGGIDDGGRGYKQVPVGYCAFICLWMKERLQMWLCGRSVENKGLQMLF